MAADASSMLFISHSCKDDELVARLIDVLCAATKLRTHDIVCSSVEGCRLPSGANIPESVHDLARKTGSFLAILTPRSIESDWVLYELGARWKRQPLRAIHVPGYPPARLHPPYNIRNSTNAMNEAEMHALVRLINNDLQLGSRVQAEDYTHKLHEFQNVVAGYEAETDAADGIVSRRLFLHRDEKLPGEVFAIEFLEQPVEIKRHGDHVDVTIDRRGVREMAISNPGKTAKVRAVINDQNEDAIKQLDRDVQEYLTTRPAHDDSFRLHEAGLPLRWASGGVLSIVTREDGSEWVPFFFRDIRPYGWNISLGQSERRFENKRAVKGVLEDELNQPLRYIEREFMEESLILSGDPNEDKRLELKRFRVGGEQDADFHHDDEHRRYRTDIDRLSISISNEERDVKRVATNCRVHVISDRRNPSADDVLVCFSLLDLGIEVVKILKYKLEDRETMLDGEIQERDGERELVRMPMALMSLEYLRRMFGERTDWQNYTRGPQPSIEIPQGAAPAQSEFKLFTWDVKRRMEIIERRERAAWVQERFLAWYDCFHENFFDAKGKPSSANPSHLFVPATAKILNLYFKTVKQ